MSFSFNFGNHPTRGNSQIWLKVTEKSSRHFLEPCYVLVTSKNPMFKYGNSHVFLLRMCGKLNSIYKKSLDEDPRSIEAKFRWLLHGTILEGNSIDPGQKIELKRELMVWKTKMEARVQGCLFHCFSLFSLFFQGFFSTCF